MLTLIKSEIMSSVFHMKNVITALCLLLAVGGFAQDPAAPAAAASGSFTVSTNTMMVIIAAILLLIIFMLTTVVYSAIDLYKYNQDEQRKGGGASKTVAMLLLMLASYGAFAQATPAPAPAAAASSGMSPGFLFSLLLTFVIIEVGVIVYLIRLIRTLTGIDVFRGKQVAEGKEVTTLWDSINKFKPISEEKSIDLGHDYDGIRELDNIAPPWFTYSFIFTILFAVVYMYRYHVSHTAPLQIEEYEISVREAKAEQEALAKLNPAKAIDENNLVLLGADEIAKGKAIFTKNCATCHALDGGGGAGPNLTDDYWIHKGSLKDIFLSVKHGYPDKGMPAWEAMMNPEQINQVTSFVRSLHGTKPAQPRDKQGDLYVEEAAPAPAADSTTASK